MGAYVKELLDLRREYPAAGLFAILLILAGAVVGVLQLSKGLWVPLIVGTVLLFFFVFLLIVLANTLKTRQGGFRLVLSLFMLTFISLAFTAWIVILTLAFLDMICLKAISGQCENRLPVTINGHVEELHFVKDSGSNSVPFEHYRSSCEDRSYGSARACVADGYIARSASVEGFWAKNNNGTVSEPYVDPSNQACMLVNWSAASGGRTGIGECRYHGHIKFNLVVNGDRIREVQGKNSFSLEVPFQDSYLVPINPTILDGTVESKYDFRLQVSSVFSWLDKFLFWVSGQEYCEDDLLTTDSPVSDCLTAEVRGSAIILRRNGEP